MSQLSVIGTLEELDKPNPLRYMTNGKKNEQTKPYHNFDPMVWFLSNGVEDIPLKHFLLSSR